LVAAGLTGVPLFIAVITIGAVIFLIEDFLIGKIIEASNTRRRRYEYAEIHITV